MGKSPTPDGANIQRQTHKVNLERANWPIIGPKCKSLDCGKKPERTHADTGSMCKPSPCEVTALPLHQHAAQISFQVEEVRIRECSRMAQVPMRQAALVVYQSEGDITQAFG